MKISQRTLYAHSVPGLTTNEWQPLEDHLVQVAKIASHFAEAFCSSSWAWNAGLLHDIGKACDNFQAYLLRENGLDDEEYDTDSCGRCNHSSAGAFLAREKYGLLGLALSYITAGHHAGLPDYDIVDANRGALVKRLQEGKNDLSRIRETVRLLDHHLLHLKLPLYVTKENYHFWVRFLFSCIVDADFLDTESFLQPERIAIRQVTHNLDSLKIALDAYMLTLACDNLILRQARRDTLAACRQAAKELPGLFSLTVPTGGGKTLAAMSFALDHAILHGKKRVIYVIPYTSIIEQTTGVLGKIFGEENVVEHHSNLNPDKETLRNQLASENWDAPIVVTTNVQFFETLFAARPSRCRKLHNIVNSVVILDEAQLVPPHLLSPCVEAINELSRNYGVTILLSTATQPALPGLTPYEIVPSNLQLYERLQRTQIEFPKDLNQSVDWITLAKSLSSHDQVLCIVNTRRDCYDLYRQMPENTIHLSASMCGEHRSKIIGSIKELLQKGQPIRVISTQLIEAGVDIDFPVVYRALAGLDSIVQAAGRCNREGKQKTGKVIIFVPPKPIPAGLLKKGECALRELISFSDFDPQLPKWHFRYFDLFYDKLNDMGKKIIENLTPHPEDLDVAFRSTAVNFRLIDDKRQVSIVVIYGDSTKWIQQLYDDGPKRKIMRRLQRYTINIPRRVAEAMQGEGRLKILECGVIVQTMTADYQEEIGLDIFSEGLPLEDLIIE